MSATERLRTLLDNRGAEWIEVSNPTVTAWTDGAHVFIAEEDEYGKLELKTCVSPEQAIDATLGNDRLAFLEEKVKYQGDYINKLTKEKNELFVQGCEAATRHAGQIDAMQRKLDAATIGSDDCSQLKTENNRLQEELEDLKGYNKTLQDRLRQQMELNYKTKAENNRLRELAGKSWKTAEELCQVFEGPCMDASYGEESSQMSCPLGKCEDGCIYGALQHDLHELGIEVGE